MKRPIVGGIAVSLALIVSGYLLPARLKAEPAKTRNIWSTVPYFNWIRPSRTPIDQYSFLINGAPAHDAMVTATLHKESLHVRFRLQYEQHTNLEIREQGQTVYRADVFYAPSYESSIVPDEANYNPFHTVANEARCRSCHRFTITPTDLEPGKNIEAQVCFPCHRHKFDGTKSQHKPASIEWRCLQCHQQDPSESQWSQGEPLRFRPKHETHISTLCFECHKKKEQQIKTFAFVHGPIGMGACTECHNPHASTWPKILQNEPSSLCVNCHEMKKILDRPFVHTVLKEKGCLACHAPHGGPARLQLQKSGNDHCLSCHQPIMRLGNNHPVQGHPVSIKSRSKKEKDILSCVSCHSPHSSDYPNLLPEDDVMKLCTHCHAMGSK